MKLELRFKLSNRIPVKNATLRNYTNEWSGNTISTTAAVYPQPILSNPDALISVPDISGWDFSNTKYALFGDGTGQPLIQNIDASLIETGLTYDVTFNICSQPDPVIGGIRPYFMGVMGDEYQENGTYTQSFLVNTIPPASQQNLTFQPTGSFNGAIGGYNGKSIGNGGVVIAVAASYEANVDLYDDDSLNLNFSYFDDISTRSSTYSKTIKLPGTQRNANIFKNIISVDMFVPQLSPYNITETVFYMHKPVPCGLYYDSAQIMIGTFILIKVIKNGDDISEYEGQFVGSTRSFAEALADYLLTDNQPSMDPITGNEIIPDLDFSMYDHKYSEQNQRSTHNSQAVKLDGALAYQSYSGSTGVYYPFMDLQGEDATNYLYFNNIKPSLYVKEIWDKIFKRINYNYESTFLNSTIFKSLIMPQLSNYQLDTESIYDLTFDVNRSTRELYTNTWVAAGSADGASNWVEKIATFNDDTSPSYIHNNSYNKTTYKMTIPTGKGGLYSFKANCIFSVTNIQGFAGTTYGFTPWIWGEDGTPTADVISFKYALWVKRGGTWSVFEEYKTALEITNDTTGLVRIGSGGMVDENGALATVSAEHDFSPVNLGDNNEVQIKVYIKNENKFWYKLGSSPRVPCSSSKVYGALEAASTFKVEYGSDGCFHEGNRVFCKYILPKDMKQIDFVKSISNMFSLVFADHPTLKDTFIIEPWNSFFLTGSTTKFDNVYDWTQKMDLARAIEYERIDFLIDKSVLLKYKEDSRDTNLDNYNNDYKNPFGSILIPNPVLEKSQNSVEIGFSSVMNDKFGSTNWPMAQIYNKGERDENLANSLHAWSSDFQPKILFRKRLTSANLALGQSNLNTLNIRKPMEGIVSGATPSQYPDAITTYGFATTINQFNRYHPYAGLYDDPFIPTLTLEFGPAKRYLNNLYPRPTINLYYKYWQNKINMFLDPNSKKITAYFRLNYSDIVNLDFRKYVLIDNSYYILYKIMDWNPEGFSKVQLLKLTGFFDSDYINPPVPANLKSGTQIVTPRKIVKTKVINMQSGSNSYYPTQFNNSGQTTLYSTDNYFPLSSQGLIIGKNNKITATDFIVTSQNNTISDDRAVILNSADNTVSSTETTIIGSSGNAVTADHVTIIGSDSNTVQIPYTLIIGGTNNNTDPPPGELDIIITGTTTGSTTGETYSNARLILINSSYNYIQSGFTQNVLINTSGQTISASGKTYINDRDVDTLTDEAYVAVVSATTLTDAKTYTDTKTGDTLTYVDLNYYDKTVADNTFATKGGDTTLYQKTTETYNSSNEYIIGDNYNGTGRTITLMGADNVAGKIFIIHDEYGNANSNNIKIQAEGFNTINGGFVSIVTAYGAKIIYGDGSNWHST